MNTANRELDSRMAAYDEDTTPEINPTVEIITGQPLPKELTDGEKPMAKKAAAPTAETKKAKKTDEKPKRMSALDAAAWVLDTEKTPMNTKALIETMARRNLWSSPNGKTPEATLYAAMMREINTKGDDARFRKVDRGQFALNAG